MQINIQIDQNLCIVSNFGNLALDATGPFLDELKENINNLSLDGFILDFSSTKLVDSTGLGSIVRIFTSLQKRDAYFTVCCLQSNPSQIFKMTSLFKLIPAFETLDEAIAAYKDKQKQVQ